MGSGEIFILEDDPAVRETLSVVLTNAGYEAICFADGNGLLDRARQRYPVCILLDVRLPGRSGLDILRELRSENYPAPIFMISGHGSIEMAVQAVKIGATDFIEKPFRAGELVDRIEKAIETMTADQSRTNVVSRNFPGWQTLTRREREILDQMLSGDSTKDIARKFGLSPRTVEDHRSSIMKKAHAKSTPQLLIAALGLHRSRISEAAEPRPESTAGR